VFVNPSTLTPGVYTGAVTINAPGASSSPQIVSVNLTVSTAAAMSVSYTSLNFAYQSGGALPQSQAVTLSSSGAPLTFTATTTTFSGGGWLQVAPNSGTTPASISVSVIPTGLLPGTYSGAITVAATGASNSTATINVTLTVSGVQQPTAPVVTAVVNSASYGSGPVSPGEIVVISGTAIGPAIPASLEFDQNGSVSTTLRGVQVLFSGIAAPLAYVSASQINAVVPYEIQGLLTPYVEVRYAGQTSNAFPLASVATSPALFTANSSGTGPVAAYNQDQSYNSPNNPAPKGSFVVLYMTGEGQTAPSGVTGKITTVSSTPPLTPQPLLPVAVLINGQPANVAFWGEAPTLVSGVMQINVQIPLNAPSGNLPLQVSVGGNASQNGLTISVQ
jgi:uncharacterized protein (TIGR03437 family)